MSEDRAAAPAPPDQPKRPAPTDEVATGRRARDPASRTLRSRQEARRAVVLRELLGPPVALRRARSDVPGLSP